MLNRPVGQSRCKWNGPARDYRVALSAGTVPPASETELSFTVGPVRRTDCTYQMGAMDRPPARRPGRDASDHVSVILT